MNIYDSRGGKTYFDGDCKYTNPVYQLIAQRFRLNQTSTPTFSPLFLFFLAPSGKELKLCHDTEIAMVSHQSF